MAPDFLSPDVQVEEVQNLNGQIPGVSTSSFALAGYSPRGPENVATITGSFTQYAAIFGSFSITSFNAYCVAAYFLNGGNSLIFVRVMHSDAVAASGQFDDNWKVIASGRGTWANGATVEIEGNPSFYNFQTGQYGAFNVLVSTIDPTSGVLTPVEEFDGLDLLNPQDPEYILSIVNNESQNIIMSAVSGGIPVELLPTTITDELIGTGDGSTVSFSGTLASAPILPGSFDLSLGTMQIGQDDGSGNIVAISGGSSSVSGSINYQTGAIAVYVSPAPGASIEVNGSYIQQGASSVTITLSGGLNGSMVTSDDVLGAGNLENQTGIYALNLIDEEMAVAVPDYAGNFIAEQLLLTYCTSRADCIGLTQPPQGSTPQSAVNYRRQQLQTLTSFGAMYYPWVRVADPLNNNYPKTIPPCGHAAGRFAYTDLNANVGMAPAGVVRGQLSFIIETERKLSKTDRDTVYQAQINPIRADANVGIALWGNKTLASPTDSYTSLNVRRSFIFLEKSQYVGILDFVFENIGPPTWTALKARIDSFLEEQYRVGVFGSGVPTYAQAAKVIVDATNNPPAVQQAKMIIVDEFIKPNLAAEFILIRLQQSFDPTQS